MSTIPQYAKSTDPEVIAVIERNTKGRAEYQQAAFDFARKYGDDPEKPGVYHSTFLGSLSVSAVISKTKPTVGRWTEGRNGNGWRPFKNNPVYAEMAALKFRPEPIPGLSEAYDGPYNRDGSQMILSPRVFMHDGVAYMSLAEPPLADQRNVWGSGEFGPQWTECYGSEVMSAREQIAEAAKAKAEAVAR